MYKTLFFLLLSILLPSCGTMYYYAQLETSDPYIVRDDKNNFVLSGDSIQIKYAFRGENAQSHITVKNQSKQMLYVDWESSWFTIGDNPDNRVNLGQFLIMEGKHTEIIPGNQKSHTFFELSGLKLNKVKSENTKEETVILTNGEAPKLKNLYFDEESTPLYMVSHIEVRFGSLLSDPVIFEQDFYIKKVIDANSITPDKIFGIREVNGDMFYTHRPRAKGFSKFLIYTGEVALLSALIVVAAASGSLEDDLEY